MSEFVHKNKLFSLLIIIVIIYVIQFFLFPNCFTQYYPVSNEAIFILIIPLIILSIVGNVISDVNIRIWAIVDAIYGVMLGIYNGMGFYGIGMRGVSLDGMSPIYSLELAVITILIIVLALLIFQLLIRILRLAIIKVKKS